MKDIISDALMTHYGFVLTENVYFPYDNLANHEGFKKINEIKINQLQTALIFKK